MPQQPEHTTALPAERAFVVQCRAEAAVEPGGSLGRGEPVVSGQATHFHTLDELLAFMMQVLITLAPQQTYKRCALMQRLQSHDQALHGGGWHSSIAWSGSGLSSV